jgi:hypothetical protein
MRNSAESIFPSNLIENLGEFKSICKTVLAHVSGDTGVQFNEKTEGGKSRETVPLRFENISTKMLLLLSVTTIIQKKNCQL